MALVLARFVAADSRSLSACLIPAAHVHVKAASHAKWEEKWRANSYGHMDSDAVRKRHSTYEKRKRRAEGKRKIHQEWRCLVVHVDELKARVEENRRMNMKQEKRTTSGRSQRFERDWKRFCHKTNGKPRQAESEGSQERQAEADPFSSSSRSSAGTGSSYYYWEQGSYSRHYNNSWSSSSWEYYAKRGPSWTNHSAWGSGGGSQQDASDFEQTIGSKADRAELGLPSTGPLTLPGLKEAFRTCALKWHPDRHLGPSKEFAESKFKRVGAAYRALLHVLGPSS